MCPGALERCADEGSGTAPACTRRFLVLIRAALFVKMIEDAFDQSLNQLFLLGEVIEQSALADSRLFRNPVEGQCADSIPHDQRGGGIKNMLFCLSGSRSHLPSSSIPSRRYTNRG